MRKIPNLISSVSVRYFRSINALDMKKVEQVNIVTGSNDVGKSNLIRALNLFFNESDDVGNDIIFSENFSHTRLEAVRKVSIKGKQFIQIEIEFNCKHAFANTLPEKFKVKKTWNRESRGTPSKLTNNLKLYIDNGTLKTTLNKAEGSLIKFLNSIKFTYVPAIKDKYFFSTMLSELQDVLITGTSAGDEIFMKEVGKFNEDLEKKAIELRSEFKRITGIDASLSLPTSLDGLFRAFDIKTVGSYGDSVSLDGRGDGVRVRFLPAIMNYIAERSPKQHIWGFEEPENSMEYRRAFELADAMSRQYSKNAQIFITTHSPAFIDLSRDKQRTFLARRNGADTEFIDLNDRRAIIESTDPSLLIADELGHVEMLESLRQTMQTRIKVADEAIAARDDILSVLQLSNKPVLLTEGPTDKIIIESAWDKLYGVDPPFVVKTCDVSPEALGGAAGAGQLARCVRSILPDSPHIVIGIFDRDADGLQAWGLDANFIAESLFSDWKAARNGKAHGLLLPVPAYEPKFAKSNTLCTELLFPPTTLNKEVDGQRLHLQPIPLVTKMQNVEIDHSVGTEPWQMRVTGNKMFFAQHVVATFEKEDFVEFGALFKVIEKIIQKYE